MQPGTYSPDGRWIWDGVAWRPAETPRAPVPAGGPPPAGRPGLLWFTGSPEWVSRYLLMGLIGLIPVAGQMTQLGWYLAARDNLRRGLSEVPRAGFEYIGRGVAPWVALLIWALYALIVPAILGILIGFNAAAGGSGALRAVLIALIVLVTIAEVVVIGFLSAAIIALSAGAGVGAACAPARAWRAAAANAGPSWRVFGAFLLVGVIGGVLGAIVSFVPVLGALAASVVTSPASYLAAAPGQADFDESRT